MKAQHRAGWRVSHVGICAYKNMQKITCNLQAFLVVVLKPVARDEIHLPSGFSVFDKHRTVCGFHL